MILLPFSALTSPVTASNELGAGPTLDKIQYFIIEEEIDRFNALYTDEIDIIGDYVDPSILDTLGLPPYDIGQSLRNGYGCITINCDKYPLNETAFRRAFALALDKQRICDDIWDGLAVPQDSCIPQVNLWSSEGQLDFNYYENNSIDGNRLLDLAGFLDIDGDSFREAPNGSEFHIWFESLQSSSFAVEVGNIAVETLLSLGINATRAPDYFDMTRLTRLYFHGDYDMMFLGRGFDDFDITWMAYDFWSEYSNEPYWNTPNWQNATFDNWRNQLLHSTVYDEVYEAAIEMQKIWLQDCPMIICYENIYLTAYRPDRFSGFTEDSVLGMPGFWTNQKVRLLEEIGGPLGGTLRYSLSQDLSTWNIMEAHQEIARSLQARTNFLVLNELYDSLFVQAPNGTILPWLVDSYTITTHNENPSIADNVTRFTLELIDGFTWSDGSPLTAYDIIQTVSFYSQADDNPFQENLAELRGAYVPTPGTLIIEFNGLSYWYLYDFAFLPILPQMISMQTGWSNWDEWDLLQLGEGIITSGPFNLSVYEEGEFIELTRNPDYYYSRGFDFDPTSNITPHTDPPFNPVQFIMENTTTIVIIIGCIVGVVIIFRLLKKIPD
jgi:ABC-type transport system substrate-binding protein